MLDEKRKSEICVILSVLFFFVSREVDLTDEERVLRFPAAFQQTARSSSEDIEKEQSLISKEIFSSVVKSLKEAGLGSPPIIPICVLNEERFIKNI